MQLLAGSCYLTGVGLNYVKERCTGHFQTFGAEKLCCDARSVQVSVKDGGQIKKGRQKELSVG